jgi:hypothetical protein
VDKPGLFGGEGGGGGTTALSPALDKCFKILFKGFSIFVKLITLLYLIFAADDMRNIFAAD